MHDHLGKVWYALWCLPLHGLWALTFLVANVAFGDTHKAELFMGGYVEEEGE
jgi:hypothetical protein